MGLIPRAKCSRCDRVFSGLRMRCPYCGARRRKKGKRVSGTDNTTWKIVIGALLLVVLIAAVIILLVMSLNDGEPENPDNDNNDPPINSDEGVNNVDSPDDPDNKDPEGNKDDPDDPQNGDETDPPTVTAPESVTIIWKGDGLKKEDVTMKVGEKLAFGYKTVPADLGEDVEVVWASSDESAFVVLQTGEVSAIAKTEGTQKITVTVNGIKAECIIRVK